MDAATRRHAGRLHVTADAGGSNGYRSNRWKIELAAFAEEIDCDITALHYPPGTSKWNRIEHRLFAFISMNWRGEPLRDHQVILDRIGSTRTESGLTVTAWLDTREYPTGIKTLKKDLDYVPLGPHEFHGEWNYTVKRHCPVTQCSRPSNTCRDT